ncbi:MAG TPA: type II toxin-antitoxin system HicA family toxin [Elusimicrobiota bacterium]|nr:type II toxin-antitoxin system HicA family toxin [Elusimicrobiota bacterium]
MRLPRDIGGNELAALLSRYGYSVTRQTGSHLRLTTRTGGEHHLTIPAHAVLRIGTLSAILTEVALHLKEEKSEIIKTLWR